MATATISTPRRSTRSSRATKKVLLGFAGVLGFLGLWQLIPASGLINPEFFPYATETLARIGAEATDLEFWRNVGRTLTAWFLGLVIASIAALILGTLVGMTGILRRGTHTTVEFLRPIPSVALIPIAILSYGINLQAALVIIIFASFWQVFVQVLYGVADIDSVGRDTAQSFSLTRAEKLRHLVLPTALPYLMTGLRLAASVALILAVTAEMTIGNPGLGQVLMLSYNNGDKVGMFAIVIVTGVLGLIVNIIFGAIERKALFWHQSVRGEDPS